MPKYVCKGFSISYAIDFHKSMCVDVYIRISTNIFSGYVSVCVCVRRFIRCTSGAK